MYSCQVTPFYPCNVLDRNIFYILCRFCVSKPTQCTNTSREQRMYTYSTSWLERFNTTTEYRSMLLKLILHLRFACHFTMLRYLLITLWFFSFIPTTTTPLWGSTVLSMPTFGPPPFDICYVPDRRIITNNYCVFIFFYWWACKTDLLLLLSEGCEFPY